MSYFPRACYDKYIQSFLCKAVKVLTGKGVQKRMKKGELFSPSLLWVVNLHLVSGNLR